jgi:DNA polymerase phi
MKPIQTLGIFGKLPLTVSNPQFCSHLLIDLALENLFSATASRERKYWGFLLFQKLIQDPQSYLELIPSIFSHNLVRCLINHVQEKDRFLNRAADKSLKTIIQMVEAEPQTLVVVLPHLIGGNGTYNFDKVTKTKTIEKLMTKVDASNAEEVIGILVAPATVVDG